MRCQNCGYWWQDNEDEIPVCHYEKLADWDLAPCEYPDREPEQHSDDPEWQ